VHIAAIARYLAGQGLVSFGSDGATCFLEEMPGSPVTATVIMSQPGGESYYRDSYDRPEFQVICRSEPASGAVARTGYDQAADVRDALHGLTHTTLGAGTDDELRVIAVFAKQAAPVSLGPDAAGHLRWSVGYRMQSTHPTPLRV
jgi:hypothetical protein